jgi:hypothetical protein
MAFLGSLILLVGFVGIIIVFDYWIARSQYGPTIARALLPQQFVSDILMIIVISLYLTHDDQWDKIRNGIVAGSIVLLWIAFTVLALRKPKTGIVLLNLGRLNKHPGGILLGFGLLGAMMLLTGIALPSVNIPLISLAVLMWSFGIVITVMSRKDTLLTEKGVRTGYIGFEWEQVKSYIWVSADKGDHYLFFKIKHRLPLPNTLLLKIAAEQQQSVIDILLQRIGSTTFISEPSSKEVAQ